MVGDSAAVTASSTRTSSVEVRIRLKGSVGVSTGNSAAPSGESLPHSSPPPPPVVDVAKAVERLNDLMVSRQRSLRFEVDAASGRTVITVINDETKEVVRQIPPPELLQLARNLEANGSLIDARA